MNNRVRLICDDQELVSRFVGKNSLLDGSIEKIEIFVADSSVCVNVHFLMRPSSDFKRVLLQFVGCKEYGFFYSEDYFFYNVESVKLFETGDGLFYASFDPYDDLEAISDKDQDFILCRNIKAFEDT